MRETFFLVKFYPLMQCSLEPVRVQSLLLYVRDLFPSDILFFYAMFSMMIVL